MWSSQAFARGDELLQELSFLYYNAYAAAVLIDVLQLSCWRCYATDLMQ